MKSIISLSPLSVIPIALIGFVIGFSSCSKKDPAKAEITVVDVNDERIVDAQVNVLCTPVEKSECKEGIEQESFTNSSGKVEFEWDHAAIYGSDDVGFAVLKVESFKNYDTTYCQTSILPSGLDTTICVDSFYTKYGSVFINLEVDNIVKETITIIRDN